MGLRSKIIFLLVILLTTVFAAITLILVDQNTRTLRGNLVNQATAFAALATKPIGDTFVLYKDSGQVKIQQQIDQFVKLDPSVTNVAIVSTAGKVLYNNHQENSIEVTPEQASGFERISITNAKGELNRIIQPYIEDSGQHEYGLVYDISNESINQNIHQVVRSILILSATFLVLSILAAYFMIDNFFLRPLREVSQMALVVSAGNLDTTIGLQQNDEIGDVAQSVHKMAESLKADIKKLKEADALKTEFMVISSHNLRTPLTAAKGFLEMLGNKQLDQQSNGYLKIVSANVERLNVFIENMLTVAQLETSGTMDKVVEKERLDFTDLVSEIVTNIKPLIEQKHLQVVTDLPQAGITVDGNKPQFRTAIWNILDNAMKFTRENGQIHLQLQHNEAGVVLTIADSGIGIASEELPKLFTKFHRATSVMEYNYEGTGLGLYLTKLILSQYQGTITVASELGVGTTVTITLPAAVATS